jgi:hypothetical protein
MPFMFQEKIRKVLGSSRGGGVSLWIGLGMLGAIESLRFFRAGGLMSRLDRFIVKNVDVEVEGDGHKEGAR